MNTPQPIGTEFLVNTQTSGSQERPSISFAGDGSFVVSWNSFAQDGDAWGIYSQRFDADGNKLGDEFQVNTNTVNDQLFSATAVADDGSFVVTWQSRLQDGSGWGVYAQRFDADGNTVGDEFRANTYTNNWQANPTVTFADDGSFLVSWHSQTQDGSGWGVYAQRFDADGNTVGDEFQVNTYTNNDQLYPTTGFADDGSFVVIWHGVGENGSGWDIYGQRFDADGNAVGDEFQVNTETNSTQQYPVVAVADDGSFVVSWYSAGQDGSGDGIYGQRFDADGNTLGDEFQVNTYTNTNQQEPAIAMADDGSFVITWHSSGQDGSNNGIYAQYFDAEGNPVGDEFQVNTETSNRQEFPTIGFGDDGSFVVSWQSWEQDGSVSGIYAQRFVLPGNTTATSGDDVLLGTDEAEEIKGLSGNDTICGADGNDTIKGGIGNDSLKGEAGDDHLRGQDGDDILEGGDDDDKLDGGTGNDILDGGADNDTLRGGNNDDELTGGSGDDVVFGDNGNDTVAGGDGDDLVKGSNGDDVVSGEVGDDRVFGNNGNDTLSGGADNDTVRGGTGDDSLTGGEGEDRVFGEAGNDTIDGGIDQDIVTGGSGDDFLTGGSDDDMVRGDSGNDTLSGGTDNDTVKGGTGDDSLAGDAGEDRLFGENGNDTVDGGDDDDILNGGLGNDLITGGSGDDKLFGDDDNDTLNGGTGDDQLTGGSGDDQLTGGLGDDVLTGESGDNILVGVDPTLSHPGEAEVDELQGGTGADTFVLADASSVYYLGSEMDDYAIVKNFDPSQDTIQLRGEAGDYTLNVIGNRTEILLGDDRVALVFDNTNLDFNNGFSFV